jgi:carbamoyltransferase
MNILGINTGSGASICLFEGDQIKLAIEEERLARIKGKGGFPTHSLDYVRTHHREILENIDYIAICDLVDGIAEKDELVRRYDRRFKGEQAPSTTFGKLKSIISPIVPEAIKALLRKPKPEINLQKMVQEHYSEFDIPDEKFVRLNHHDCHAAAAYYGLAQNRDKPYLLMTLDGGGDSECGSISIGNNGKMERVISIPAGNSIGNIYSNITYILGLTPHEHEYKIMGLEPYVPEKYRKQALETISSYLSLSENGKGISFERTTEKNTNWIGTQLADDLKYMRFDSIAAGLQEFTETIILQWVRNAIEITGISDILLSGGVFMNVKVNKLISEMPEVTSVNVFPSCGDESNAVGIVFHTYANKNGGKMPVFDSYTLGPTPGYDLETAKLKYTDQCNFVTMDSPAKTIAKLLADGKVVARCNGPMEIGARALGNRSLLADPSNADVVERINFVIKQRDFWMPFAPAMLAEDASEYIEIPASVPADISPYMMFAFETTDRRSELAAALHRADKTARAQIVSKERYPGFHDIISEFKSITGRSVVLNTSYNLHGHPIVMGTCEAVDILLQTELEYLAVDDQLITKR